MRVFLALNFDDIVKHQISELIQYLKPFVKKGRFVRTENLHLTLEFLGEMEEQKVAHIQEVLEEIESEKFVLQLSDLQYFKARKGRLYWLGMDRNEDLFHLQKGLHRKLLDRGFTLDTREFLPHITIGRNIKLKDKLPPYPIEKRLKRIKISVQSIELMESKVVGGKLTYTVIASKTLR